MFWSPSVKIEFLCRPEDKGVIAEPIPAVRALPDWFKRLPAVDKRHVHAGNDGLTIKRCMPFLDAMTTGWVLTLAATVRLEIADDGATVKAGWDFDREMVSPHGPHQVEGYHHGKRPPMKFHNYWSIRTPKGWSCLITPLLNRPSAVFEVLSGVVDTDSYHAYVNLPFVATAADGVHVLEKGAPLAQVIPFRRAAISADVRAETPAEAEGRVKALRNTRAGDGWYRKVARAVR